MRGKLPEIVLNAQEDRLRHSDARLVPRSAARLLMDTLTPEAIAATGIFDAARDRRR